MHHMDIHTEFKNNITLSTETEVNVLDFLNPTKHTKVISH